jgi:hypothetical protein
MKEMEIGSDPCLAELAIAAPVAASYTAGKDPGSESMLARAWIISIRASRAPILEAAAVKAVQSRMAVSTVPEKEDAIVQDLANSTLSSTGKPNFGAVAT